MSFSKSKIVCKGASSAEYHQKGNGVERGDPKHFVSASMLKNFAHCPARWKNGYESPESEAKKFGSLLDVRLLTPTQFADRFAVRPATYKDAKSGEEKPFNLNATICKEWVKEQGDKEIITSFDNGEIDKAIARIKADETFSAWLAACDTQVWIEAIWTDEKTGLKLPCKALLDFVPRLDTEFQKSLGDLKSVRSALLQPFSRQVYQFGWHVQAAFYLDMYLAATGEDRTNYCLLGVENYPPFEPFRRLMGEDFITIGRQTYGSALKRYARCLKSGEWPGYDDLPESHPLACSGFSLMQAEPWMEFQSVQDFAEFKQEETVEESNDIIP